MSMVSTAEPGFTPGNWRRLLELHFAKLPCPGLKSPEQRAEFQRDLESEIVAFAEEFLHDFIGIAENLDALDREAAIVAETVYNTTRIKRGKLTPLTKAFCHSIPRLEAWMVANGRSLGLERIKTL